MADLASTTKDSSADGAGTFSKSTETAMTSASPGSAASADVEVSDWLVASSIARICGMSRTDSTMSSNRFSATSLTFSSGGSYATSPSLIINVTFMNGRW